MKRLQLTLFALLAIPSIADAQSWRVATALYETEPDRQQEPAVSPITPPFIAGMVRNANDCGADHTDPVWGSSVAPLGYTCSHNENGG